MTPTLRRRLARWLGGVGPPPPWSREVGHGIRRIELRAAAGLVGHALVPPVDLWQRGVPVLLRLRGPVAADLRLYEHGRPLGRLRWHADGATLIRPLTVDRPTVLHWRPPEARWRARLPSGGWVSLPADPWLVLVRRLERRVRTATS